jgi:hypothetical protein
MKAAACLLAFAPALAATGPGPRLFYSKAFPGSAPPYMEVILDKQGRGEYREAPNEEDPLVFQLDEADVKQVFDLATALNHFQNPLESGLKVAKMGEKTFRWEDGAARHEQKFNYSLDENARLLQDWFEKMTESALHRINLERTARFDRLGVNKALLQIEAAWDRKRLVAVSQFLPMLDRVAKNESYLHMARGRAAALADAFRATKAKTE